MSPRKALDQSLLQQLKCMRESPVCEDAQQNKRRTRLDVAPGKSISNLDFVIESGSETNSELGPDSEPEESDIEENDDADDEQQVITLLDISAGDFALVKYNYSWSVKC